MLPAVKVLPKITGKYQPSTVSENAVYSEPMVYTEAWKEYSRNDDEVVDGKLLGKKSTCIHNFH